MNNHNEILKQQISEQIALEEHFYNLLEQQILQIDSEYFEDAKSLLINAAEVLGEHYTALNLMLDSLDQDLLAQLGSSVVNGSAHKNQFLVSDSNIKISKILRDDYSALNLLTISNTLLHTTALALNSEAVASLALKHLENLVPFVIRIGELMPDVITRELQSSSSKINSEVAETALRNAKLAWEKSALK
jgi:hypothetical protein